MEEQGEVTHRFWAVSPRRPHPGGHRHRRAVVAGHRVQPHPPRRRAPVEAAAEGRHPCRGHPRRPQPEPARAGAGAVRARRRARARRHRRGGPRHPRRRRRLRAAVRPAGHRQGLRPPLRPHRSGRRGRHGHHLRPAGEGEGRAQDAARAASPRADRGGDGRHRGHASSASTPPKPIDRGDDLDGVSRRERARARSTASPISVARPPPVAARPTARAPARGRWRRATGPPGPSPASPRPPRAATDRSVPGPRHALVAPAPSPADDPLVQEPPVRAAPPAATHADARAERPRLRRPGPHRLHGGDEVGVLGVLVGAVALAPGRTAAPRRPGSGGWSARRRGRSPRPAPGARTPCGRRDGSPARGAPRSARRAARRSSP